MLTQDQQTLIGVNSIQSLPFSSTIPSFEDGDLFLHADDLAIRVHASVSASRSHALARQLTQPTADFGTGVRVLAVRRAADLPLLLECLYHINPLRRLFTQSAFTHISIPMSISWSWDLDTSPPSLSRIAALSDVASYYGMPDIRRALSTHLDLLFPPHLTDYVGALRAHLTPGDWDPLVVWDLVTKHDLPQTRFPHVETLALLAAATSVGDDAEVEAQMDADIENEGIRPSENSVLARDAFRAHMLNTLRSAFSTGAIGLEWSAIPCPNLPCGWEAAQDVAERRYRSLAFDICSDLAEDIVGSGDILDTLCVSCREAVPRAGERLREQVWAWLCREDREDLEDPFVIG